MTTPKTSKAKSAEPARPGTREPQDTTQRGVAVPDRMPSLPHERDQQNLATNPEPDPQLRRAARDLQQGQVDTDLRATPGLDADRRGDLVAGGERGAGTQRPERSQPPQGAPHGRRR